MKPAAAVIEPPLAVRGLHRLRRDRRIREFLSYGLASALALAVDFGLLVLLTEAFGLHYSRSAPIAFLAGMAVVYGISVRFVFAERRFRMRSVELAGFLAIGLAGLVLNQIVLVGLTALTPLSYQIAKVPTASLVFLFNFAARRGLLFRRRG